MIGLPRISAGAFLLALLFPVIVRGEDDIARIKEQQIASFVQHDGLDVAAAQAEAEKWAESLQPDGGWSDIDYADQNRSAWKTSAQLSRTVAMAQTYVRERAAGHADPALLDAALRAFRFWTAHDFHNPNWWHNEIGAPRLLVEIMLLLQPEMDAATRAGGLKILDRLQPHGTGQNLVWETGIALDKALFTDAAATVRFSREVIFSQLKLTRDEGLQPDFSFHQHGAQQQFGNYGLAFAGEMTDWAAVFRGTGLALSEEQLGLLRQYLTQGEAQIVWHGVMDVGSCGRQLGPKSPSQKGGDVIRILKRFATIDPDHAIEVDAARKLASGDFAPDGPGLARNIDYYASDYIVHRQSGFAAYLKMCSRRVIGTEEVNKENLSGRYLADGALWIYETGPEGEDIFPMLDWHRIPGVTCSQRGPTLAPAGKMDTDFAGGVSDGLHGAAGLAYNRDGVTAYKSWFFLDGRIVCLGAGIDGPTGIDVATSLDQRLSPDAVVIDGRAATGPPKPRAGVSWICAGTRGFVFTPPQAAVVGIAPQQGDWHKIYNNGSPENVTKDIFSIWLDHGAAPKSAQYAVTILPATTPAQVQAFAAHPAVEIISNTPGLQAVRDPGAHLLAAIFFAPGTLSSAGHKLAVDQPCAVLLHDDTGRFTVADPTQKESSVTSTLDGTPKMFSFPTGLAAGQSVGN